MIVQVSDEGSKQNKSQNLFIRKEIGRKRMKRNRTQQFRENQRLKKEIAIVNACAERYKKKVSEFEKESTE